MPVTRPPRIRTLPCARTRRSLLAAAGLVLTALALGVPAASAAGTGPANLWVDADGGTCVRQASPAAYASAQACSSLNAAYQAARGGDVVRIVPGTYGAQTISPSSRVNTDATAVRFLADGGSVTFTGDVTILANYVTLDGQSAAAPYDFINDRHMLAVGQSGNEGVHHVTVNNYDGRNFDITAAANVTLRGGDYGPSVACRPAVYPGDQTENMITGTSGASSTPHDIVIDGVAIHDFNTDNASACHSGGLLVQGGYNVTIRDSRFYRNMVYDILWDDFTGSFGLHDWTVENNWFGAPVNPLPGDQIVDPAAADLQIKWNGVAATNWLVRYNSFALGFAPEWGGAPRSYTNFRVVANTGQTYWDGSDFQTFAGCGKAGVTYAYNAFGGIDNLGSAGSARPRCAATDVYLGRMAGDYDLSASPYVSQSIANPDFRLAAGTLAQDRVTGTGADATLATDIAGLTRPQGAASDAGASEVASGVIATPPDTLLTSGPAGATTATSATFTFDATTAGSTFECRIDGGAWAGCASPKTYSALAVGSHVFDVRATDLSGDIDPTPASSSWTVTAPGDTVAPDTTITATPPSGTATTASVGFTGSDNVTPAGSLTFECKLDTGAYASCASPKALTGLTTGSHTYTVRAIDAAGNADPTPATATWTVTTAPATGIWYVDPQATGGATGTSWADAWTSPASIAWASVKPGDTIYFSGSSISQTYTSGFTVGASGTAGSPIVLAAATDLGHDGQVVFDFNADGNASTRTAINLGSRNHVTIQGRVGGTSHWQIRNLRNTSTATASAGISGSGNTGITVNGLTFDDINNPVRLTGSPGGNVVTSNTMTRVRGDAAVAMAGSTGALDSTLVQGNSFELYCNLQAGNVSGPDGIQAGSGVTVRDNRFKEVLTAAFTTSSQHPDSIQVQSDNLRVVGNDFQNVGDSNIDFDTFADGTPSNIYVYNNLFRITDAIDPYPEFFRLYRSSGVALTAITNVKLVNNLFADNPGGYRVIRLDGFGGNPTGSGNEIKNNIFMNDGGANSSEPIIRVADSTSFTASSFAFDYNAYYNSGGARYIDYRGTISTVASWVAANEPHSSTTAPQFVGYTPGAAGNDYRLADSDTTAVDRGVSLAALFAVDRAGAARPAGAAWDIGPYERAAVVAPPDVTAPDTSVVSGPSGSTSVTSASLVFSATETATFECRLDGGAWASCGSPKAYSGLAVGAHTFDIRAIDAAGNVDASPASRSWTIVAPPDVTAPDTSVVSGPSGSTSVTSASLVFSATETATFECRLDGGAWASCGSPKAYSGLAVGAHTFDVRAIDAAGNVDASPASRSWTIVAPADVPPPPAAVPDTTSPETTVKLGPAAVTTARSASFTFASTESPSTFSCKLDGLSWSTCTSGKSYSRLARGTHVFQVRARDASGNVDATPASYTWSIVRAYKDPTYAFEPLITGSSVRTVRTESLDGACAALPSQHGRIAVRLTGVKVRRAGNRLRVRGRVPELARDGVNARVRVSVRGRAGWRLLVSRRVRVRFDGSFRLKAPRRDGRIKVTAVARCD